MTVTPQRWFAMNVVSPGSGLVLAGEGAAGVVVSLLFVTLAGLALFANLVAPDDFSPTWRALLIGGAIGIFVGAQLRLSARVARLRKDKAAAVRRAALTAAREALLAGEPARAWEALSPLEGAFESDLLVAYRVAQVLTLHGRPADAYRAWQRVRRLDRHNLYGDESRRQIELLRPVGEQ